MRLHRPVLAGLALGAVLPVTAAEAATGVTAAGSAVSTATIATVSVGELAGLTEAQSIAMGTLSATAGSGATPAVTFVPVTLNGVKNGAVTVTPANSPQSVGTVATDPLGVVAATSPAAKLTAAVDGAASSSGLESTLGSVNILGLPVGINGGLDAGSVSDASHAQAGKAVSFSNLSLPNLSDLLGALGIDVDKLPVTTLNALITDLHIAIDEAKQTALDAANDAVTDAEGAVTTAEGAVATATTGLATATTALETELNGVIGSLPAGMEPTAEAWDAASDAEKLVVTTLSSDVADAATAYTAAKGALESAEDALEGLEDTLFDVLEDLADLVDGVLAGVSLVSIGEAQVATKAAVGSAKEADVTGFVEGVEVLGTDVLEAVTGDSKVDVAKLVGDAGDDVNAAIATTTAALSSVLSTVTGATGLVVPAPEVEVLTQKTLTGTDGLFGTAEATVSTLSISLGSATIPTAYALEDAGNQLGIAAVTGGFKTAPLSMTVGTLVESARFRPGAAPNTPNTPNTPTTPGTPNLPATGGPLGLAVIAVIGTGLAVGVRRHLRAE